MNKKTSSVTELKILDAARREFIVNGLRGARMQEIANRAGINKALLHYHFKDKENLYGAAILSIVNTVLESLKHIIEDEKIKQTPKELLEALVRSYVTTLKKNPQLVGVALRELSDGGQHIELLLQLITPTAKRLIDLVVAGLERQGAKAARTIPPEQVMINMMSMVWGTFLLQPLYSRILPAVGRPINLSDAFYEQRIRSITETLLAGMCDKKKGKIK